MLSVSRSILPAALQPALRRTLHSPTATPPSARAGLSWRRSRLPARMTRSARAAAVAEFAASSDRLAAPADHPGIYHVKLLHKKTPPVRTGSCVHWDMMLHPAGHSAR